MPAPFVIAGWFVELGSQFIPAGLVAKFDSHDGHQTRSLIE
jgi:hypothetical protein